MCGNLILPAAIDYVYFYMKLNLRNLLYVIVDPDQLPVPLIQADFFGPDQDRKQFLISVAFQQSRLAEGIQQAEGQDGSKEIAELAANDGVVIMDPSLIEIAGGFIA